VPKGGGTEGSWRQDGDLLRFRGGPDDQLGARFVGVVQSPAVRMPHNRKRGTRYDVVIRGRFGQKLTRYGPPFKVDPDFYGGHPDESGSD
jgi:hypothetical protein